MECYAMVVVRDVAASSHWYQELLGLKSGHGGGEFEMLMSGDRLVLMLHHRDSAEHPAIAVPAEDAPGAGVLLYFSVTDVQQVFERAREMDADLIDEPHENPKANAVEFSLRDPDGYALTVSRWGT